MAIRIWSSMAFAAGLLVPPGAVAQSLTASAPSAFDARVEMPDGRRLHLVCTGPELTPHPVVLFESELGHAAGSWAGVQAALPDDVRACAYDRPDTGSSERAASPVTIDDDVADLHALLSAARIPPPYVVVAEGVGVWFAGAYLGAFPDEVAGAVFTDAVSPTRDGALRGALGAPIAGERPAAALVRAALDAFLTQPSSTPGGVDLRALSDRALGMDLGDRPLVILEPARPSGALGSGTRPFGPPRPLIDTPDPWDAAWARIETWAVTRSTDATRRSVPGGEGIAARRPDAVADAIADVHAALGGQRGPGRAIARLRLGHRTPSFRPTGSVTRVEDRSGQLVAIRPATGAERRALGAPPDATTPTLRELGRDHRRIALTWMGPSDRCAPTTSVTLSIRPLRVVLDTAMGVAGCTLDPVVRTVVLELRAPVPASDAAVARYEVTAGGVQGGPDRITVDVPGEGGPDQVEIETPGGRLVGARALTASDRPRRWQGGLDGVQTARVGDELLVRWSTLPCVTWSRVTVEAEGTVDVQDGAVPACDESSAPRGVALRLRVPAAAARPGARLTTDTGTVPVPDGALIRQQADAAAVSLSLADFRSAGARLAQALDLDARLAPPDRWVWAVSLHNPAGDDVCPDGVVVDGLPCPNLSATTTYLDAVTGEPLLVEPGGL